MIILPSSPPDLRPILLFTSAYPFGTGEGFIGAELEELARFHTVHVFPKKRLGEPIRTLPPSVTLHSPTAKHRSIRTIGYAVRFLKFRALMQDVAHPFRAKSQRPFLRFLNAMRAVAHHVDASVVRRRIVASRLSEQDPIYYAYWGDASALALALHVPQDFGVRFHGGDLYHDRKHGGQPATQRRIVANAARVIAISDHGRNYLNRVYPDTREKLALLYLGVPCQPKSTPTPVDAFTFASISYAVPVKRLDRIVDALIIIITRGEKARWIHIGDGPELSQVARRLKHLGLAQHVHLVGHLPQAEAGLYPFLRETPISVVVNTSESEGLPVSLMEAISFGIPVIATNVGGTSELVIRSGGTLLPTNARGLDVAEALLKYIDMPDTTLQNARSKARESQQVVFNHVHQTQRLVRLLSQI